MPPLTKLSLGALVLALAGYRYRPLPISLLFLFLGRVLRFLGRTGITVASAVTGDRRDTLGIGDGSDRAASFLLLA